MSGAVGRGAVLVTGAGSGIGHALTLRLLAEGYGVAACDLVPGRLEGTAHPALIFRTLDVRDRAALDDLAAAALERWGRLEGLASCAAVFPARPFLELDEATWDATFDVNLKGSLFACQAVLPAMRAQGAGSILLFSSTLARSGSAGGAHYAATKGGILGLARSLALEVAREGIRVNTLSPGLTDTPQPRGNASEAEIFARARDIPLGRIGHVSDMVESALFLLDEAQSSFVTGQDLRVNGGARLF